MRVTKIAIAADEISASCEVYTMAVSEDWREEANDAIDYTLVKCMRQG